MAAMVSSESRTRRSVPQKIESSLTGEKPSSKPLRMPVSSRLVPVAESQLKTNTAGSAVGLATTGGTRKTASCRTGNLNVTRETRLRNVFAWGTPQANTRIESRIQGIQAFSARWLPITGRAAASARRAASVSCSKLQVLRGCQNFSSTTSANMETNDPAISTTHGPCRLLTRNCVTPKLTPAVRHAGHTSSMLLRPAMAHTSQNGTTKLNTGRIRPTMALS